MAKMFANVKFTTKEKRQVEAGWLALCDIADRTGSTGADYLRRALKHETTGPQSLPTVFAQGLIRSGETLKATYDFADKVSGPNSPVARSKDTNGYKSARSLLQNELGNDKFSNPWGQPGMGVDAARALTDYEIAHDRYILEHPEIVADPNKLAAFQQQLAETVLKGAKTAPQVGDKYNRTPEVQGLIQGGQTPQRPQQPAAQPGQAAPPTPTAPPGATRQDGSAPPAPATTPAPKPTAPAQPAFTPEQRQQYLGGRTPEQRQQLEAAAAQRGVPMDTVIDGLLSHYDKDGLNKALTTPGQVLATLGTPEAARGAGATPAAPKASTGRFGPADVYANIPEKDSRGEDQIKKFMEWNPDPVGNHETNLRSVKPQLQTVFEKAQKDNPGLRIVVGAGVRSQQDQEKAVKWGWSKTLDSHHADGSAMDVWVLDQNGRVTFDEKQLSQVGAALKKAASELGVKIRWGGDYKSFKDRPHFELG